jgi:hypothetical protein
MVVQASYCFLVSGVAHADKKRFKLLDSKGRSHAAAFGRARTRARSNTGVSAELSSKKSFVRQIRPRITSKVDARDNPEEFEPTEAGLEDDAGYWTDEAKSRSNRSVQKSKDIQHMESQLTPAVAKSRLRSGLCDSPNWTRSTRLPKQLSKSSLDPFFRPAIDLSIADQHLLQSCE